MDGSPKQTNKKRPYELIKQAPTTEVDRWLPPAHPGFYLMEADDGQLKQLNIILLYFFLHYQWQT